MPQPFRLSLSIRLLTPLSSGAAGAEASTADKVVVRNGIGEYIIPGSQIRGTLRHACERVLRSLGGDDRLCHAPRPEQMCPHLAKPGIRVVPDPTIPGKTIRCCPLCAVFGSPYFPSPLQFHDLVCENPARRSTGEPYSDAFEARMGHETLRAMVSLNRRRRVAEAQRLFFIETTPPHTGLVFSNDLAAQGTLERVAEVKLLLAGFRVIVALGGGRSRGLGWITTEVSAQFGDQPVGMDHFETLQELWHNSD